MIDDEDLNLQPGPDQATPGDGAAVSPIHEGPFVGHQELLADLRARVAEAARGHGSAFVLVGDSGVGKSRVLFGVCQDAEQQGVQAIYLPCRGSLQRPLYPLAELVRQLLGVDAARPSSEQRAQIQEATARLDVPEAVPAVLALLSLPGGEGIASQQLISDDSGPSSTVILSDEIDLPSILLQLIGTSASTSRRSILIALDDLDQGSDLTRMIVHDLVRHVDELPLLILATYAPGAPSTLRASLDRFSQPLIDLPFEDTLALADQLLGVSALSNEMANLFWRRSGGRPLLILLLAEFLLSSEILDTQTIPGEAGLVTTLPAPRVREIVAERIRRLGPAERDVLLAAAVLGDGMRIGALRALRGAVAETTLYTSLTELVRQGWLEASGSGRLAAYRFAHDMIREMIYRSIPAGVLESLHLNAGDYYAVPATGRRLRIDAALYHYELAHNPQKALMVIDMGLAEARRNDDREQIIALYRRGARVASQDNALAAREAEMVEHLGDIYAAAGDFATAAQVYGNLSPKPTESLELLGKLGLTLLAVDPTQSAQMLAQLLDGMPPDEDSDLRWRLEAGLVWAMALSGRTYDAVRYSRDSLAELSSTSGLGSARTLLRGTMGMALYYGGNEDEALSHIELARAGWGARGNQDGVMVMNQVLIGMPKQEITQGWLRLAVSPLLVPA